MSGEALLALAGWQPIETAPRDGSYIIGGSFGRSLELNWVRELHWITAQDAADDCCDSDHPEHYRPGWSTDGDEFHPTHWMHLPAPEQVPS